MQDWRGRGRPKKHWAAKRRNPTPASRPASSWRQETGRRGWSWKVDGIDIRVPLLIVIPLAFVGGGLLPRLSADAAAPTAADNVGVASVIDGDTLEIHGRRIRLHGIDAPEGRQTCERNGVKERCGQASARHLDAMIGGRTVQCETLDVDQYGRDVSTCWAGDTNVNAAMVRAGHAVAYRHFSRRYVGEENEARRAERGVWATEFEMPWDWRRR